MDLSQNHFHMGGFCMSFDVYNDTTPVDFGQPLVDRKSENSRPQPWAEHKGNNELMAAAYLTIGQNAKAARVASCAPRLQFEKDEAGRLRLRRANFCRVRLCPVCQWRRSLKLYGQTVQVVDWVSKRERVAWVMLTLTVRNVEGPDLSQAITDVHQAWHRMTRTKPFTRAVLGWQRCVEVTHNTNPDDTAYNTYHPHIHALMAVRPSYFTGRDYISRTKWCEMWRSASRIDYDPQVWVTRTKGDTGAAVAEVTKYAAKPGDYLTPWDVDLMGESIQIFDAALARRRLVAFGGLMKQAHAALGLDDPEDGDLIHTDNAEETAEAEAALTSFWWVPGYRQYYRQAW